MLSWIVFLAAVWLPAGHCVGYRSADADFMVGAILPLSNEGCVGVNPAGSALAEAIVYGIEIVKSDSAFQDLRAKGSVGYDIRDNCGDNDETRSIAHDMAQEALDFKKTKSGKKPVDVVISDFTTDDNTALLALAGAEILAAASYSPDNARLKGKDDSGKLISIYPEQSKKITALGDIVEEFGFKYVFVAIEDDGVSDVLEQDLQSNGICAEDLTGSVMDMVKQIASKPLVNVAVIDLDKSDELDLYQGLEDNNVTDLSVITTESYTEADVGELKTVSTVVDGGFSVYYKRKIGSSFAQHMKSTALPYTDRDWLQAAFKSFGGNETCLTPTGKTNPECMDEKDKVKDALVDSLDISEYAFQAVVALAFAQQKAAASTSEEFLAVIKGLNVEVDLLGARLRFGDDLSVSIGSFAVNNMRMRDGKLSSKQLGTWSEDNDMDALNMRKRDVIWTDGRKDTPTSVCTAACAPGSVRVFRAGQGQCCWDCAQCPNGTASNISNANSCHGCPEGTVVRPDQSGCKAYTLVYFEWFGGPGAVVIVLMIIGVALVLFGLGVFSQNTHHEVVINANYNSLCVFLLALLLLIFCPVPLLVKPPSGGSCSAYILLFNLGVSIALGVLTSRSAWINGFFDENGELQKGTLGRYPRTTIVAGCAILQLIVMIVSFSSESILTMHNLTDQWDERYHECSSWASSTFWAGFVINIIISVVGNSMSCSSINMEDNVFELKYVLLGHLMWYLWGLIDLIIFFRCNDEHLAGGQAIVALFLALSLFIVYAWPKMFAILFQSKGGKLIPQEEEEEEEGVITEATAVSSKAGFTGTGIVSVKIREEDN